MDYKQLQEEAKKLGLKYVGVSTDDLTLSIKKAKKENKQQKTKSKKNVEFEKYDIAVVYRGVWEIRRYTLAQHGNDFVKLANQYAEARNYRVELKTENNGIKCPHCGKRFILS